jgi:hypothetical protein
MDQESGGQARNRDRGLRRRQNRRRSRAARRQAGDDPLYYLKELRDEHPVIQYVADRRFVVDKGIATTTGITASMPMSLTLSRQSPAVTRPWQSVGISA